MAKIVGQNITVTAAGVPAGSTLSNVAFQADPATFQPVSQSGNVAVFLCLQAATGVTIAATGTAADGSGRLGVSDPFDVGAPVATSIAVTVE